MLIYLQLFYTFFQIGLFGFGGGYGMLSLIQREVVFNHGWMTSSDFTDIVAISQMTPGPIGINSATYAGYTALQNTGANEFLCILGSITATFSVVLPSLILMLAISRYFMKYANHPNVRSVFNGLRPAVVGLLAAATLMLMNAENFGNPFPTFGGDCKDTFQFGVSCALFLITFAVTKFFKFSPIKMIVIAGVIGGILL